MSRRDRVEEAAQYLGLAGHYALWGPAWRETTLYDHEFVDTLGGMRLNDVELAEPRRLALRRADQYLRKAALHGKVSQEDIPRYSESAAEEIERRIHDFLDTMP